MTIDPRWGFWFSVIAALVSGLLLCGAEFTTIFGTENTAKILATLGIVNTVINGANAILHMIPAQTGAVGAAQFPLGPGTK
jgi:hypothetical protein